MSERTERMSKGSADMSERTERSEGHERMSKGSTA
jgi:hypothetical protein